MSSGYLLVVLARQLLFSYGKLLAAMGSSYEKSLQFCCKPVVNKILTFVCFDSGCIAGSIY